MKEKVNKYTWLIPALLLAFVIVACGPAQPRTDSATATAVPTEQEPIAEEPTADEGAAEEPTAADSTAEVVPGEELATAIPGPTPAEVAGSDYTTTDSGLQYYDIEEGDGATPADGEIVSVHYSLWLVEGEQFIDSSLMGEEPIEFILGS